MQDDLVTRLRAYAAGKPAAIDDTVAFGEFHPTTSVRGYSFAHFILKAETPYVELAHGKSASQARLEQHSSITLSKKKKWDRPTWHWVDVPLDGSFSEALLRELIDQSYKHVVETELSELDRELITLSERNLTTNEELDALITLMQLDQRRDQIVALAEPTVMLATRQVSEEDLRVGQTKIGGLSDLPADIEWPTFKGQPLGFLAQVNLRELPVAFAPNPLPAEGLLLFFSIFGLEGFFETSDSEWLSANWSEQGFSQVLYVPSDADIERQQQRQAPTNSR